MAITVTEKAANAVKRIVSEQQQAVLTPDMLEGYRGLCADLGRIPTLDELAGRLHTSVQELTGKLGQNAASFGKVYLRMSLRGGGCSGFQPKLDLDPQVNEGKDEIFEFHGVPVAVDRRSLMYLDGTTVDFHDDLNRHGFSVDIPQSKSKCGCGSSVAF